MTLATMFSSASRSAAFAAILVFPLSLYSQVTLTGAIQFSANSSGAFYDSQVWNTLCCDIYADLWLALNPDGTSPVNGPSDGQAGIDIPLKAGHAYTFYIFGQPGSSSGFNGLNLFFDSNNASPGISVFGATNSTAFAPNSSSTLALEGNTVNGSGTAAYTSAGFIVLLVGYNWNTPATPPGDVCQFFAFSPAAGDIADFFGSFTLDVHPAASLSLNQGSGSPGAKLTLTGAGFSATETVDIYAGRMGTTPLSTTTTDTSGAFTATLREPQLPYGPVDFYAVGLTSGELGVASLSVTPTLTTNPATGAPGGAATAYVFGFGADETVNVYWNEPRQLLGTATANGLGSGALTITIPADASPGVNGVIGVGQTTKAIGIGKVTVE